MRPLILMPTLDRIDSLFCAIEAKSEGIASEAEVRLAALELLYTLQKDLRRHLGADEQQPDN